MEDTTEKREHFVAFKKEKWMAVILTLVMMVTILFPNSITAVAKEKSVITLNSKQDVLDGTGRLTIPPCRKTEIYRQK